MATLPFSIAALHCWLAFRTQGHLLVAVSPLSTATLLCWLVLQDPRAPPYGHLTLVHGRGSNVPFLENPSLSVSLSPWSTGGIEDSRFTDFGPKHQQKFSAEIHGKITPRRGTLPLLRILFLYILPNTCYFLSVCLSMRSHATG